MPCPRRAVSAVPGVERTDAVVPPVWVTRQSGVRVRPGTGDGPMTAPVGFFVCGCGTPVELPAWTATVECSGCGHVAEVKDVSA